MRHGDGGAYHQRSRPKDIDQKKIQNKKIHIDRGAAGSMGGGPIKNPKTAGKVDPYNTSRTHAHITSTTTTHPTKSAKSATSACAQNWSMKVSEHEGVHNAWDEGGGDCGVIVPREMNDMSTSGRYIGFPPPSVMSSSLSDRTGRMGTVHAVYRREGGFHADTGNINGGVCGDNNAVRKPGNTGGGRRESTGVNSYGGSTGVTKRRTTDDQNSLHESIIKLCDGEKRMERKRAAANDDVSEEGEGEGKEDGDGAYGVSSGKGAHACGGKGRKSLMLTQSWKAQKMREKDTANRSSSGGSLRAVEAEAEAEANRVMGNAAEPIEGSLYLRSHIDIPEDVVMGNISDGEMMDRAARGPQQLSAGMKAKQEVIQGVVAKMVGDKRDIKEGVVARPTVAHNRSAASKDVEYKELILNAPNLRGGAPWVKEKKTTGSSASTNINQASWRHMTVEERGGGAISDSQKTSLSTDTLNKWSQDSWRDMDFFDWENREELAKYVRVKNGNLGAGTYGTVVKVENVETRTKYAMKQMSLGDEAEGVPATVIREVSVLKDINHPHCVGLHEVFVFADVAYLVFELCDMELKGYMKAYGKGPSKHSLNSYQVQLFMTHLITGLDHVHMHRIVHRDLKPQNLLVNVCGASRDTMTGQIQPVLKIADFGLSRVYAQPLQEMTHEVVTVWYRPPEILFGSKEYGPMVDIWSAGAVFAEMATGRALFPGECEIHTLFMIFQKLGTPTEWEWPDIVNFQDYSPKFPRWRKKPWSDIRYIGVQLQTRGIDLLEKMMTYDPNKRISAGRACRHAYFQL